MLRKIKFFGIVALLAVAMVAVSSCGKEKKIVGKWKITSASGELKEDKGETWTFKEKGDCTVVIGGENYDGEWSISGDNLSIDLDEFDEDIEVSGDFTVDELSSKAMSISGEWIVKYDYNYDYKGSKDSETEKIKANYDFEKK